MAQEFMRTPQSRKARGLLLFVMGEISKEARPNVVSFQKEARNVFRRDGQDWVLPARYEVRKLIGTGSYGNVCEAFDRDRNKLVAIKRIPRVFEDLIDCERILR